MRKSLRRGLRWLGILPAALSLVLQLALGCCGTIAPDVTGDLPTGLDEHALCRATAESSSHSGAPGQQVPVGPAHEHLAFCCLGHQLPAVAPVLVHAHAPIGYALIARDEPEHEAFIPAPLYHPGKARAPPTLT